MEPFKALRIYDDADATATKLEQLTMNDLSAGDVIIKAHYSSINYKDALAATGGSIAKRFPIVGGIDVSGVVEESSHEHLKPGDKVVVTGCGLSETHDGGYSEYVRVRHEWVMPLPNQLTLWDAMALGTAGFTAGLAIQRMEYNGTSPDKGPIVVTGATGGVGSLAVNMLSQLGYDVTALTSKREQDSYLKNLGAKNVLMRQDINFGNKPLEEAQWAGAIDNVGGEVLAWLTRTTGWWGNIASIGLAGGQQLHTTVMPFILRGISLLGINSMATPRPERLTVWKRLATDLKPNDLDRIGHRTVQLAQLPDLFNDYIDGAVTGRTIVSMTD